MFNLFHGACVYVHTEYELEGAVRLFIVDMY